jgi:hypothetical protein
VGTPLGWVIFLWRHREGPKMTERAEVQGKLDDPVLELQEEYNSSPESGSCKP